MSKGALAFLAGMGSGYLNESKRQEDKKRQDKFDQIALDKADYDKSERDRATKIQSGIEKESQDGSVVEIQDKSLPPQPVSAQTINSTVGEQKPFASQGFSASPQNITAPSPQSTNAPLAAQGISKSTWQVGGKSFNDADSANKAAQEYNTPEARNSRIAQVYRSNGDHATALRMEAEAKQAELTDFNFKVAQHTRARNLQQEGVFDAAAALRRGDANAVKAAFNSGGQFKIDGDVNVSPVEINIPGIGKKTAYQATFNVTGPDGKPKQMSYNSHELSMQLMPAEKALEFDYRAFKDAKLQDQWKQEFEQKNAHHKDAMNVQRERISASNVGSQSPVWNKDADKLIQELYTSKDNGVESIDSAGVLFAKKLALGMVAQNGGDSFSAIHDIASLDAELKRKSGGNPKELAKLRDEMLSKRVGGARPEQTSLPPPSKSPPPLATTQGMVPDAPREKMWIGNEYKENPEYTQWFSQYGAEVARKKQIQEKIDADRYKRAIAYNRVEG